MFENIYVQIALVGIGFNFASLFLSVAYHSLFTYQEQVILLKKIVEDKGKPSPFKSRLVYLIPFSVGVFILYTMFVNTVYINRKLKDGE